MEIRTRCNRSLKCRDALQAGSHRGILWDGRSTEWIDEIKTTWPKTIFKTIFIFLLLTRSLSPEE
jgi:hypothetical protein